MKFRCANCRQPTTNLIDKWRSSKNTPTQCRECGVENYPSSMLNGIFAAGESIVMFASIIFTLLYFSWLTVIALVALLALLELFRLIFVPLVVIGDGEIRQTAKW